MAADGGVMMMDDDEEEEIYIDPRTRTNELLDAVKAQNLELITELIEIGVPLHTIVDNGWTCLHYASLQGNESIVALLIQCGAVSPYKALKNAIKEHEAKHNITHNNSNSNSSNSNSNSNNNNNMNINEDPLNFTLQEKYLLNNTPLHWACANGHKQVMWFLLNAGYDPDDCDKLGNSALHIAASNGHRDIVEALIKFGCNTVMENIFRNNPADLCTNTTIRGIIKEAQKTTYSTDKDVSKEKSLSNYENCVNDLFHTIGDGSFGKVDVLDENIKNAIALGLPTTEIENAKQILESWNTQIALENKMEEVVALGVITKQQQYCDYINGLRVLIEKAKLKKVTPSVIQKAEGLIQKGHTEYWLEFACVKLRDVVLAGDECLKDMKRLKGAIDNAKEAGADTDLLTVSSNLNSKLVAEVQLSKAISEIPTVRLPIENPAKDYWQEEDVGHIFQNDGFPLPPEEGYKWIKSDSFLLLLNSEMALNKAVEEAEKFGGNADEIERTKEKIKVVQSELQLLEEKNEQDLAAATAAAEKAAKKLKKKGGKKGKK